MNILICGGGNLGHVMAAWLAAQTDTEVSLLTRHPERWRQEIELALPGGEHLTARLRQVTSRARDAVPQAGLVMLCLPGFAIADELRLIGPLLSRGTAVGSVVSSTGFFFEAMRLLPGDTPLLGYQRVPFIARTARYGHEAHLLGFKQTLNLAVEQTTEKEYWRSTMERLMQTPTRLLPSHYEASLSNSNPLLHPARLFSLWKDWEPGLSYPSVPLFYEQWTDEASQLLINMDNELRHLLRHLHVEAGQVPPILDYYESSDAPSLTQKLRSITAFKGIKAPMVAVDGGFMPDLSSRYFTEDFPYGLNIVRRLAKENDIATPTMNLIGNWERRLSNPYSDVLSPKP